MISGWMFKSAADMLAPKSTARTLEPDARRTMANPKASKIVRVVDRFVIAIWLAPNLKRLASGPYETSGECNRRPALHIGARPILS